MQMQAVNFEGCFGWLHQTTSGPLGVVLCASWEYEALATHQSLRVLADGLAAAGLPTLRFDYFGSGDSLGESAAPGAFESSIASIRCAIDALRRLTGVERVALVGHRLGAAFALLAARAGDIDRAVLIRPLARGKLYIAEQRALAKIVALREGAHIARNLEPGAIEVEGFRLSAEAVEKIAAIDFTRDEGPVPRRVLIAGEAGSQTYVALGAKLAALGAVVEHRDLAEVSAWGPTPVPTAPPISDSDVLADWLGRCSGAYPHRLDEVSLQGRSFVETAISFGPAHELTGILCRPNRAESDEGRRVVLFLSSGANSHIGTGRTWVEHARALAERGVASLRMDCLGIGDSRWLSEGPLGSIHHVERVADVSSAIDYLRRAERCTTAAINSRPIQPQFCRHSRTTASISL